jgi:response regulator RpfG family c-di-GMP phosphodiesterase
MMEEEESARMKLEDTTAKLLRIQQKSKDAVNKNKYLRELKEKATTLHEEDVMVSRALARSKPLVTEIIEYFSVKESENNNREERIETLVEAL